MIKILLVEDDLGLSNSVFDFLDDFADVMQVFDGEEGLYEAESGVYDLILLDLMLPEKNGFQVLKELREKGITTPVLIMTAKESLDDKGHGFELGADDYLTKPFAIEELLARIRVALKHHEADSLNSPTIPQTAATSTFTIKDVSLDVDRREVCVKNDSIELTTKEFEVLRTLMEHAGVVMSRERIAAEALGYEFAGETNNVDVHIAHLRAKIDDRYNIKLITTVRGVGYVIREA